MKTNTTPTVTVKCSLCDKEREIQAGEIEQGDFPMCDDDGMPMLPVKLKAQQSSTFTTPGTDGNKTQRKQKHEIQRRATRTLQPGKDPHRNHRAPALGHRP